MENKNEENFFEFLPENSIITYKKYKFDFNNINESSEDLKSAIYSYDLYSNQFIYLFKDKIYIFNTKGNLVKKVKLPKMDKIRFCTCEKDNNYILCITEKNVAIVLNAKKDNFIKYDPYDPKIEVRLGYIHGGFFVKHKINEKKKEEEIDIGLIGNNSYRIVTIIINGKSALIKNTFASQKIQITEYYYNNKFNILVIRNEYLGFFLINLKNSHCYSSCIELTINNIYFTSKFFLQNIYNKLYFIHFTENLIEFYRLKDLKVKKEPKTIKFNKLYDIKSDFSKKMGKIDIPKDKIDGFFDKIKIRGKFVMINDNIYKIKFLPEIYKNKNKSNTLETFFNLLRRKNTTNVVTSMLINLLKEYELSTFFAIFFKISKNYIKSKNEVTTDDKKNPYEIIYKGHNSFYLSQDNIFSLFNNEFNQIENLKMLQVMIIVYNEYTKNDVPIDKDAFIPALFYLLSKTDDFSCLDFIIKNKNILMNKNLGLYLIDRAKSMNDKNNKNLAFNLGIEMLMMEIENINEVINELVDEEKYDESVNIIVEFYLGYKYDKKDKNIKYDINKSIKKFIAKKLINTNKTKARYISMIEEEIEF